MPASANAFTQPAQASGRRIVADLRVVEHLVEGRTRRRDEAGPPARRPVRLGHPRCVAACGLDPVERGIGEVLAEHGNIARVDRIGSILYLWFRAGQDQPPASYDDIKAADAALFGRFFNALLDEGVAIAPSAFEVPAVVAAANPVKSGCIRTEAVAIGLATRVSDTPYQDALELAREIAGQSPDAVRAAKQLDLAWRPAAE